MSNYYVVGMTKEKENVYFHLDPTRHKSKKPYLTFNINTGKVISPCGRELNNGNYYMQKQIEVYKSTLPTWYYRYIRDIFTSIEFMKSKNIHDRQISMRFADCLLALGVKEKNDGTLCSPDKIIHVKNSPNSTCADSVQKELLRQISLLPKEQRIFNKNSFDELFAMCYDTVNRKNYFIPEGTDAPCVNIIRDICLYAQINPSAKITNYILKYLRSPLAPFLLGERIFNQCIELRVFFTNYLRACVENNIPLCKNPSEFLEHAYYVHNFQEKEKLRIETEQLHKTWEKAQKYCTFETDDFVVFAPEKVEQILDEANQQSNCVYRLYREKYTEGDCYLAFARRKSNPDKSLVTIEIDPFTGAIRQALLAYNMDINEQEHPDIALFIKQFSEHLKSFGTLI